MGLIDVILNLACVLLWLNWSSVHLVSARRPSPVSLAATLRKAEPRWGGRWGSLLGLFGVLSARSLFYWKVGSASNWTPNLELGVVSLPFRSDYLTRMILFSFLSFMLVLGCLYAWLLLISIINRKVPNDEPLQKLVRLHLGWIEHWPPAVKVLLPLLIAALAWGLGSPALVRMGIVPPPSSPTHTWQQALVLGVTSFLTWKSLVLLLCVLYMINSYVYLGKSRFWQYVNTTGSNLLRPLRRLPVRIGKLDFSPLLAMGLVLVVAHWAGYFLPRIFQRLPF